VPLQGEVKEAHVDAALCDKDGVRWHPCGETPCAEPIWYSPAQDRYKLGESPRPEKVGTDIYDPQKYHVGGSRTAPLKCNRCLLNDEMHSVLADALNKAAAARAEIPFDPLLVKVYEDVATLMRYNIAKPCYCARAGDVYDPRKYHTGGERDQVLNDEAWERNQRAMPVAYTFHEFHAAALKFLSCGGTLHELEDVCNNVAHYPPSLKLSVTAVAETEVGIDNATWFHAPGDFQPD